MTSRFLMTKKDPRRTDFVLVGHDACDDPAKLPFYTSDTTYYSQPYNGSRAMTTITHTDRTGDHLQVGVIEWPAHPLGRAQLVVGTRNVQMTKSGLFTSPEQFTAADGRVYEWQIQDARPQLVPVPLQTNNHASTTYVACFLQSRSGFFRRKHTSSLFIAPEGSHILHDIVVTFIYFESQWREKERLKSRSSLPGAMI